MGEIYQYLTAAHQIAWGAASRRAPASCQIASQCCRTLLVQSGVEAVLPKMSMNPFCEIALEVSDVWPCAFGMCAHQCMALHAGLPLIPICSCTTLNPKPFTPLSVAL